MVFLNKDGYFSLHFPFIFFFPFKYTFLVILFPTSPVPRKYNSTLPSCRSKARFFDLMFFILSYFHIFINTPQYIFGIWKKGICRHLCVCMAIPSLGDGLVLSHCHLLMWMSIQITKSLLGVTPLADSKC